MAYATVSDVEARLGRTLSTLERGQVEAWLSDIEEQVNARVPTLAERILTGSPSMALVKAIIAGAVKRAADNPKGLKSRTLAFDDYSRTEVSGSASTDILYLTDEEWNLLLPGSSGDAFTIRPYGATARQGQWVSPDVWVPL
ncbi:hypothetical protein [Arthrobacter roseus]|uniref:hypothetical protein n=1 Tax=Arthrobacter roseus TaxID=136274 RepID=UPI00196536A7|nr:hypothetical protein [Arthrobacter roseus]MBM7847465.1 hypothetical protein [Arthrobacter roseus]